VELDHRSSRDPELMAVVQVSDDGDLGGHAFPGRQLETRGSQCSVFIMEEV